MTFGSDVSRYCQSTVSSFLVAHALITTTNTFDGSSTEVYEVTTVDDQATITISNLTSLMVTGLAVAEPVVVAWNLQEMTSFPTKYRNSLASRIGVVLETNATPVSTPALPNETGDPTGDPKGDPTGDPTGDTTPIPNASLSTGAKAGIGVGVVFGVALVLGAIVLLWLRRRKQGKPLSPERAIIPEMADQDRTHARRRWFLGGRWRTEVEVMPTPAQELDSKTVRSLPGPPVEMGSVEVNHREGVSR